MKQQFIVMQWPTTGNKSELQRSTYELRTMNYVQVNMVLGIMCFLYFTTYFLIMLLQFISY
jgi:hypothetical protein